MSTDLIDEATRNAMSIIRVSAIEPAKLLAKILRRRTREEIVDEWHEFVEHFHMDPLEFYELVHEDLQRREIPGMASYCVTYGEGGIGTAQRLYLRLDRRWGRFDICAAPFGTGFFFSYRQIVPTVMGFWWKVLLGIFVIGLVAWGLVFARIAGTAVPLFVAPTASLLWVVAVLSWGKNTYYQQDTALMYALTVSTVVKRTYEAVIMQAGAHLAGRVTAESAGA